MMEGCSKLEISALVRTISHRFAVGLAILSLLAVDSNQCEAQLRSGRKARVLYQDDLRAELGDYGNEPQADYAVTTASYADHVEDTYSNQYFHGPEVVPASCSSCDGCDSCGGGFSAGFDSPLSCGASGCDGMGCDVCCGGASTLAPTCTAVCPPGCGPLMALWYRMSFRAEVPIYWRRDQGPPSLVTTAPDGTAADIAGQIGEATTETLLGNGTLTDDGTAGIRLTFGTWLGAEQCYGLMFRYWNAGTQEDNYNFNSNQFPILARPFFNTTVDGAFEQDTQLIAFPGETIGNIRVETSSEVSGLEFSLRRRLYEDRFTRVDWLYGFQNVSIQEGIGIFSNTTVTGNVPALQGTSIAVSDVFRTENDFNGMSYGIMSTRRFACWRMETMFRLGAGNLRRKVNIAGSTTTSSGGVDNFENQGLLARNTNNQEFVDDTFVVVPELGINFAYRFRPGVDFNLGYNYMVIPKVAQAAQQIDNELAVNLSDPLVGALDPQLDFTERQYWLHSLGFGFQVRY